MIKVGIVGAAGRMGRNLVNVVADNPETELAAAVDQPNSDYVGRDAGEVAGWGRMGVKIVGALKDVAGDCDAVIDFSLPDATADNLAACQSAGAGLVIGTTGHDEAQKQRIRDTAVNIPVVYAPNYSAGVNLAMKLIDMAARALGDDFDVEVLEAHHRHKVDAPSGTAVRMGEVLANALGRELDDCAVYARQGHTGARPNKAIGFQTIRAGDIVGEHTVMFAGAGERIEITHKASSRMTFASGAVRAAVWAAGQPAGLYDMDDVLGLK